MSEKYENVFSEYKIKFNDLLKYSTEKSALFELLKLMFISNKGITLKTVFI